MKFEVCLLMLVAVVVSVNGEVQSHRVKRSVHSPVFRDCGNSRSIIRFQELSFTPDPIVLPGPLSLTFKAQTTRAIPNMDVDVHMTRKMSLGSWTWDMTIPCVMEVGSCTYTDICGRMREGRQQEIAYPVLRKLREGMEAAGAPTRCPIRPTRLQLENLQLDLPEIPSMVSGLADGTYGITYRVKKLGTDVEYGCLEVQATISTHREEAPPAAVDTAEDAEQSSCWFLC